MSTLAYLELARMALQAYMLFSEKAGATEEEQKRMFEEEYQKFKERDPEDLPDV